MGELIEFPLHRRFENEPPNDSVLDRVVQTDECSEYIHVFDAVPGRCKCGENEWMPDDTMEPPGIGVFSSPELPAS